MEAQAMEMTKLQKRLAIKSPKLLQLSANLDELPNQLIHVILLNAAWATVSDDLKLVSEHVCARQNVQK